MSGTDHPAAALFAAEHLSGRLSRRGFLTRATALGLGAGAAHGLIGLTAPARAQATPRRGGTLRMEMETREITDPRLADWSQIANFYRGWLDYLVRYEADGTLVPMLLRRWEANADATAFTLELREGVSWNNGDPFTVDDVAHNIARWCDGTVAGNSMAVRMRQLIDPETRQAREGAIEILDPLRLRLSLAAPDITLMASMADYPAAIVHPSFTGGDPSLAPIGTGPYLPEINEVGQRQVLVRNPAHRWWGSSVFGGPYLDRIEYIDLGTDPAAKLRAAEAGEIDATYQTGSAFVEAFDATGWHRSEVLTAATLAVRFNQRQPPYGNRDLRRALQMAVNNEVVLELGHDGRGLVGENHHVCPIHPEYAPLGPPVHDPAAARALLDSSGHGEEVFELVSLDDSWQARSCDAVVAQLLDAGIDARRKILPGAVFWSAWRDYPFSATEWNMRPLGVQILALAYRSDAPWNETHYANPEFDALLARAMAIADADARREMMAGLERMLREDGVLIQPYWRTLHRHAAPRVQNIAMHPTFEHHHDAWWIA